MALRDKLRTRVQPLLEPGETIQEVFLAQEGKGWMVGLGAGLLMLIFANPLVIAATDRAIVVFRQSKLTATPQALLARLPRDTPFGPVRGLWAKVDLSGKQVYVHRRFHGDVRAADAEIAGPPAHPMIEPDGTTNSDT
jgi:hypothetical protein